MQRTGSAAAAERAVAPASAAAPAVEAHGLTKRYGRHLALEDVDLQIGTGQVFGYLGPNGAGKTTTIRLLCGLIRPSGGSARVLGLDVVRDRDRMQGRIGYLPGDFAAYKDLTGEQYLRFLARLRAGVDWRVTESLAARLDLDLGRRIATLSHGNRQKVGIVQALMHRPELVVLDEPTTGLDPIIQREFLDLVREIRDEGRTVFLSSHVLSEVEVVADAVGILRAGRLVVVESVDTLKARARRLLELSFRGVPPTAELAALPGVHDLQADGRNVRLTVEGSTAALLETAAPHHVERIVTHEPDLEEIFLGFYQAGGTP